MCVMLPTPGLSFFLLQEGGASLCSVREGIGGFCFPPISVLYLPTSTLAWVLSLSEALWGELSATGSFL